MAIHNSNPHKTYTQGINQFTDITFSEFEATYLNLPQLAVNIETVEEVSLSIEADINWI
jgi:GTP:adenosylcobinamide-phosphate guanylyltransferase